MQNWRRHFVTFCVLPNEFGSGNHHFDFIVNLICLHCASGEVCLVRVTFSYVSAMQILHHFSVCSLIHSFVRSFIHRFAFLTAFPLHQLFCVYASFILQNLALSLSPPLLTFLLSISTVCDILETLLCTCACTRWHLLNLIGVISFHLKQNTSSMCLICWRR